MTEFNVLGALALASISGFAATQSATARPATVRAAAQPADAFDRSARAGATSERTLQKTGK